MKCSSSSGISILGFLWDIFDFMGLYELTLLVCASGSWGTSAAGKASWGNCSPKRPMSASHSSSPSSRCSFYIKEKEDSFRKMHKFKKQALSRTGTSVWHYWSPRNKLECSYLNQVIYLIHLYSSPLERQLWTANRTHINSMEPCCVFFVLFTCYTSLHFIIFHEDHR